MQAALMEGTMAEPATLRENIKAYEAERTVLEDKAFGQWALFFNRKHEGTYEQYEDAAADAVARFGSGPYLIRRIGSQSVTLPTSVLYGPFHPIDTLRV